MSPASWSPGVTNRALREKFTHRRCDEVLGKSPLLHSQNYERPN